MIENDSNEQVDPVPSDLRDIQKTLGQLDNYKRVLEAGTFSGKLSKEVSEFREFINELYKQAYDKFTTHPYYIEQVSLKDAESN